MSGPSRTAGLAVFGLVFTAMIPAHAEAVTPGPMSLPAAVAQAIGANPQTLSAVEAVNGAEAGERSARAAFLPSLSGAVSQQRRTTNLLAQGFDFPGIPPLIGPYNVFDARLRLAETVFDWSKILARRSAALSTEAAMAEAALAREQIASRVAVGYIEVLRSEQAVDAANSDLELAQELLRLARDQQAAGIANGVDVARADTAVARDRFAVSQAQTGLDRARLSLLRVLNLPQGQPLQLVAPVASAAESGNAPIDAEPVDSALRTAQARRQEKLLARRQVEIAELEVRGAEASRLPNLSLAADYGLSSNTPEKGREDTYAYGAQVNVPIYTGGAIAAQVSAARSRLIQAQYNAQDVDQQIEQDVRLALATLRNSREQLRAADAAEKLAEREMSLARDRFSQGVASNIEVVEAQNGLADARRSAVDARAAYDTARANLAAATGRAEQFKL
jgi:outer membrane protein TolC